MTFKQAMMRYLKNTSQIQALKNKSIGPIIANNFLIGAWKKFIDVSRGNINKTAWEDLRPKNDFYIDIPKTRSEIIHFSQVLDNEGIFWNSGRPFSSYQPWKGTDHIPTCIIVNYRGTALYSCRSKAVCESEGQEVLTLSEFVEKWHDLRERHDAIANKIFNSFKPI